MTEHRTVEERIALWFEEEAAGHLPDQVLEATFDRTRAIRRRPGPSAWRPFTMSRPAQALIAAGAAAIVIAAAVYFRPNSTSDIGGSPATTSPTPSATLMPSPSPSGDATGPIDTRSWVPYTSGQYGFTIGHPADWTESPATRAWSFEADAVFDPASPSRDSFYTEPSDGQGVRVSAWSVPVEPPMTFETSVDLEPWVESYCGKADHTPCTGIHDRAVPLCLERRDCHPGLLVPFSGDVVAFFTNGALGEKVTIVAVWRPDADPAVAQFGGSRRLLEAFISTMCVWPEDARPDTPIPGC